MDFSAWSPSHLLVAIITLLTIVGQAVALFVWLKTRVKQLEEQSDKMEQRLDSHISRLERLVEKQGDNFRHALEKQAETFDKRFGEVNQQIASVRADLNQQVNSLRAEIGDVRTELSKLNQNHIEHLTHHQHQAED